MQGAIIRLYLEVRFLSVDHTQSPPLCRPRPETPTGLSVASSAHLRSERTPSLLPSLRLDVGVSDHLGPFFELGPSVPGKSLRRAGNRLEAERSKALFDLA